jgi:hypothetical protein
MPTPQLTPHFHQWNCESQNSAGSPNYDTNAAADYNCNTASCLINVTPSYINATPVVDGGEHDVLEPTGGGGAIDDYYTSLGQKTPTMWRCKKFRAFEKWRNEE